MTTYTCSNHLSLTSLMFSLMFAASALALISFLLSGSQSLSPSPFSAFSSPFFLLNLVQPFSVPMAHPHASGLQMAKMKMHPPRQSKIQFTILASKCTTKHNKYTYVLYFIRHSSIDHRKLSTQFIYINKTIKQFTNISIS